MRRRTASARSHDPAARVPSALVGASLSASCAPWPGAYRAPHPVSRDKIGLDKAPHAGDSGPRMSQITCSCGCGTAIEVDDTGLEITIPVSASGKAIHSMTDHTMVTMKLDANGEERLIAKLKARFRDRV